MTLLLMTSVALSMGGCHRAHKQKSIEDLDKELASASPADPAVKSALEDQILVDPQLATKANQHSIRPPDEPYTAPIPPSERKPSAEGAVPATLGQQAYAKLGTAKTGCDMAVAYSAVWATKLPADVPIYPQGHVSEAAGSDTPTCHLRIVSYTSGASSQSIADFYSTQGKQAGYALTTAGDTTTGLRAKDNAMFKITLSGAANGGTSVDVVSNAGR
jgi:hypothetical protein